jgi:hypothetical protein
MKEAGEDGKRLKKNPILSAICPGESFSSICRTGYVHFIRWSLSSKIIAAQAW